MNHDWPAAVHQTMLTLDEATPSAPDIWLVTPRPMPPSGPRASVGAVAAAAILTIGGLAYSLSQVSKDVSQGSQTSAPGTYASLDLPPEVLPAGSVLRFQTPVASLGDGATATVFDTADGAQVCTFIVSPSASGGGCDDNAKVEEGRSYSFLGDQEGRVVLFGLTALDIDFTATVGDVTAHPDGHGFWYIVVPAGSSEFVLSSARGRQVVPITTNGGSPSDATETTRSQETAGKVVFASGASIDSSTTWTGPQPLTIQRHTSDGTWETIRTIEGPLWELATLPDGDYRIWDFDQLLGEFSVTRA